jgi:hypothetical protein
MKLEIIWRQQSKINWNCAICPIRFKVYPLDLMQKVIDDWLKFQATKFYFLVVEKRN